MITARFAGALALGATLFPRASAAIDKGYGGAWSAMSSKIRASDSGDTVVFFASALAIVVVAIIVSRLYNRAQARAAAAARAPAAADPSQSFRKQAVALGFRAGELGTLRQVASRLEPKKPGALLTDRTGRQRLIGDVSKRLRRRQRELDLLKSMLGRLELAREDQYHARETIRVESDIPVWFVQKAQTEDGEEEIAEGAVNMEPVSGRLLDLSEGGAAVAVDLPLNPGEMVEFWSADTQIWIPPLPAGVVSIDEAAAGGSPVVHLHFLDPPLADIRRAMQDVQLLSREEEGAAGDGAAAGGDGGEAPEPAAPPADPA